MTNDITIKSGIDINNEEFKNYYDSLKEQHKNYFYLDMAVSGKSPVLNEPIVFEEKDYNDYKVDDISFILSDEGIIGHMVYSLEKTRPTIPLSLGNYNHLDLEKAKQLSGRIAFNRLEYFCKYNIDINEVIVNYLSGRVHGKLEYKGIVPIENKIHIKK